MAILNLCQMAERPDIRDQVTKIANEIYDERGHTTADIVDGHEQLSMYIKEAMRLESPSVGISTRIATKDVTIRDIIVRKGDQVLVLLAPLNMDGRYFPEPSEFVFDRFSKENVRKNAIPKHQVIAFGLGKRAYISKSLGELAVKLFITSMCKRFEFTRPADTQYFTTSRPLRHASRPFRCEVKPFINVKLK